MAWPHNSLPPKPWVPVESIPFSEAVLCVDCNLIVKSTNDHCPVCDGHSILRLSAVLDRSVPNAR